MTRYDPKRHHRRSIRLKGYDYSRPGAYFVTICTQGGACLFGQVVDGHMRLNPGGEMVWRWWRALNDKYPSVCTDAAVVMPNHFHGIIVITDDPSSGQPHGQPPGQPTGQPLGQPTGQPTGQPSGQPPGQPTGQPPGQPTGQPPGQPPGQPTGQPTGQPPGQPRGVAPTGGDAVVGATLCGRPDGGRPDGGRPDGNPDGRPPTLGQIVGWFKTMTTNEYIRGVKQLGWTPFPGKVWQRNYYEHIIRNRESLERIRGYIQTNLERWAWDRENPRRKGLDELESWIYSPGDSQEE